MILSTGFFFLKDVSNYNMENELELGQMVITEIQEIKDEVPS